MGGYGKEKEEIPIRKIDMLMKQNYSTVGDLTQQNKTETNWSDLILTECLN